MKSFVLDYVNDVELSIDFDDAGNLFITKGMADVYPCVAAHLDEIHTPCEKEVVIYGDKIFTVADFLTKKDDKNVYYMLESIQGMMRKAKARKMKVYGIIINLLHTEPVLKVALFVQEERSGELAGCRGARACNLSFFDNVKYILECDRKGCSDVVSIGKGEIVLCEYDFIPQYLLHKYGYEMVRGGKTDVVELKMRGLKIPVCNVGCGYYNAHKKDEYTIFSELQNCLSFVREILRSIV